MPQIRQAEGVAGGFAWPWPRLIARISAVMALVVCAAFMKGVWDAFKPAPVVSGFYDQPSPPSLVGYFIFALLLCGAVAALWKGNTWVLALGWIAVAGALFIDYELRAPPIVLFALAGLGLALAAWFPQNAVRRKDEID